MARTMTETKPHDRYPLDWVAAIAIAAILAIAATSGLSSVSTPSAPTGSLMVDGNLAP